MTSNSSFASRFVVFYQAREVLIEWVLKGTRAVKAYKGSSTTALFQLFFGIGGELFRLFPVVRTAFRLAGDLKQTTAVQNSF